MGRTKVNSLEGLTSGTVTDINDLNYQIAKAWVNFKGAGTVAIRASYNVASITDNATGDFTANFTTAMPDANYLGLGTSGTDGTVAAEGRTLNPNVTSPTTTAYRFVIRSTRDTIVSDQLIYLVFYGN